MSSSNAADIDVFEVDRALGGLDAFRSAAIEGRRLMKSLLLRAKELETDAENRLISDSELEQAISDHSTFLIRRFQLLKAELRRAANHGLTPAPRIEDGT